MNKHTDLFSTFTPANKAAWTHAASAEIEGKNPFEALAWENLGVKGAPYYDASGPRHEKFTLPVSAEPFLGPRCWYNMPVIKVLDEENANKAALKKLTGGADGILFEVVKTESLSLDTLLKNIEWPFCQVSFIIPENPENFFSSLEGFLNEKKFEPESIKGFVWLKTYPHHPQSLHKVVHSLNSYRNLKLVGITSTQTNAIEHISDLLANAVTEIDMLTESGLSPDAALRQVFFSINAGSDFFIELTKLKVLRILWERIVTAYKSTHHYDVYIHVFCEAWHNETFQPHENMLAGTTRGLSAVLGGCSSLTLEAAAPEEHLNRIALNISNILREESHINKVADPTAGAYYLEHMCNELSDAAWTSFLTKINQA